MEELYHYAWKNRMLGLPLRLTDGSPIEILDPGIHNLDAGPDFFNAKIKTNGKVWVGNVEIHVKASDWMRHNHDKDPAYDSVILHAVAVNDTRVCRMSGEKIPQTVIALPEKFFITAASLSDGEQVRCAHILDRLSALQKTDWIESLGIERLQAKASRIHSLLRQLGNDWQATCFVTLARALGFGLNAQPFEMLAKSVPLNFMGRHSDNTFQLEAILFGQAGMLDSSIHIFDEYYQNLCREYYFLARKYGLRPLRADIWKYARTRPQNFPHRRIALLARILTGGFSLLSRLKECASDIESMRELFDWRLDGYWEKHSDFDIETAMGAEALGKGSINLLIINFAVPMLYTIFSMHGDLEKQEHCESLLRELPPENNAFIRRWKECGIECRDAFESQALLQLRKEYCDLSKCRDCRFGHILLRKAALNV